MTSPALIRLSVDELRRLVREGKLSLAQAEDLLRAKHRGTPLHFKRAGNPPTRP